MRNERKSKNINYNILYQRREDIVFALGGSPTCRSSVASAEDQFLFQLIVLKVKQCRG